jgi:sigma-E factor negative regulatory protein RseA
MTDQIREQMSALLDGELPQDQIGLLVRRMERDTELKRAFGSYVLIGETLRAPGGTTASHGFATRVQAILADGTPRLRRRSTRTPGGAWGGSSQPRRSQWPQARPLPPCC